MGENHSIIFLTPDGRKENVMITLKKSRGKIRIKKIVPANESISDVYTIFSKYTDETLAKGLAAIYKKAIGTEEFVILENNSVVYELSFNYGSPGFEKCEAFKKMIDVLTASGMTVDTAYECASAVFFAKEDANEHMKKVVEEIARKNAIAQERLPWIPAGYRYYTGNMYEGIVIADKYGNQFTYVPYLDIYVSRYEISRDEDGYAASVPDRIPWVNVSYKDAYNAAIKFDPSANSDLLTSTIVNAIGESIFNKTGKRPSLSFYTGTAPIRTGAIPQNMVYNIDCFIGNHYCMLKTKSARKSVKVFGSSYYSNLHYDEFNDYKTVPSKEVGFRICLKRNS